MASDRPQAYDHHGIDLPWPMPQPMAQAGHDPPFQTVAGARARSCAPAPRTHLRQGRRTGQRRPAHRTRSQPRRPCKPATHQKPYQPIPSLEPSAKGHRWGWRVPDGRHALPICMRTRPPSREYTNGRQSGTLWGTRCSGGKSAGSEHLRAACHRPSMWEGLYPLPTIRDGNTFDKIKTLLTGAEMTQGRLA